ncbi:MAG: MtrB/PioB family decaheme-associated outer membrane protein [Acidobacteriota bacterium]
MNTKVRIRIARSSVAVVRGVLVAMALAACAAGADAQTAPAPAPAPTPAPAPAPKPTGTIEAGIGDVGQGNYKAGEYNGLQDKGAFAVGDFDVRGGPAYYGPRGMRWRITGADLGVDARSLAAQVGIQGRFRFTFGYDQLRRNRSDSYQTPYSGTGTNVLTLPSTWQVPTVAGSSSSSTAVNTLSARGLLKSVGGAAYISTATNSPTMGGLITPNAAQLAQVYAAADADLPAFHTVDLSTTRKRFDAGVSVVLGDQWGFDASVRPEHKSGAKPMGTVSRNTGGDISTVIPDLIDSDTTQMTASLNVKGAKGFAQAGYYGSFFTNNVPFMSWQNWATGPIGTGTVNTMSSAPSSRYSQVSATGGFNLTPATKVVASGSYARTTQNDAFLTDPTTVVVPLSSLNGLVVTTGFNVKLTARPAKRISLVAAYKYDNRDNQTPVHIYQFADAGEAAVGSALFPAGSNNPYGALLAQNANANRPYSRRVNQFTADADFGVAAGQWIKTSYVFEKLDRSCAGTWVACVDVPTSNEHTLRADWRAHPSESFTFRAGYAYSTRKATSYNENAFLALVPYASLSPVGATPGVSAFSFMTTAGWTGYGPTLGYAPTTGDMNLFFPSNNALANAMYANLNRISELPGMRRYFVADRDRHKVRTLLDWQLSDQLSLQAGVDLNNDIYPSATYGLQSAKGWAAHLDASYALADDWSATLFYTYEKQRSITAGNSYTANSNASTITNGQPGVVGLSGNSCDGYTTLQQRNNNNKIDPCLNWSANMLDKVETAGFGLRKKAGDLDLAADVVVSRARWDNNVMGGNWANNVLNGPGAAPTTVAAWFIPATALPTVSTDSAEVRLNARYAIGASQTLHLGYAYLRMRSADWAYEGRQVGSLSGVLPTNEQPFNYGVNVFSVSYAVRF